MLLCFVYLFSRMALSFFFSFFLLFFVILESSRISLILLILTSGSSNPPTAPPPPLAGFFLMSVTLLSLSSDETFSDSAEMSNFPVKHYSFFNFVAQLVKDVYPYLFTYLGSSFAVFLFSLRSC